MWEALLPVSQPDTSFYSFKGLLRIYWKYAGCIPPWSCLAMHRRLMWRFKKLATRLKLFPRKRKKQHINELKFKNSPLNYCPLLKMSTPLYFRLTMTLNCSTQSKNQLVNSLSKICFFLCLFFWSGFPVWHKGKDTTVRVSALFVMECLPWYARCAVQEQWPVA